jgi:predicted aconitase
MSSGEMTTLVRLAAGRRSQVPFFVNMGRHTLTVAESSGLVDELTAFGATIITDTCIYITPIMGEIEGHLMTNSAKVAYYAPSNLGVAVTLGSLSDCVESAVTGRLIVSDFAA